MGARSRADRDDDRRTILAALTETREPLRIYELLRDAWGIPETRTDFNREAHMRTDLRALEHAGKIVSEWARGQMWMQYRLATLDDLDAVSDRDEVARQLSHWQPADGGYGSAYWDVMP